MRVNFLFLLFLTSFSSLFSETHVPRTVIALYDGKTYLDSSDTHIYKFADKPLNQTGIQLRYVDIHQGLPEIKDQNDILGVLTWFDSSQKGIDPQVFLNWSLDVIQNGKKYVVIGIPGFELESKSPLSPEQTQRFWNSIGIEQGNWIVDTYLSKIIDLNPEMMNFERDSSKIDIPYQIHRAVSSDVNTYATARYRNDPSFDAHLAMTGPKGSYLYDSYALFTHYSTTTNLVSSWRVNPFNFFSKAFNTNTIPKPDPTTMAGRRVYYSHIDGDGWNNHPQLTRYKEDKPTIAAEVVYREMLDAFPDMPCSVGLIAADIDPDWFGTEESRRIAKLVLALPQVEAASHTFTHPFDWKYYEDYQPTDEVSYLKHYKNKGWGGKKKYEDVLKDAKKYTRKKKLNEGYDTPRAFAQEPFDLDKEIAGSIKTISDLAPEGKTVQIVLWSGDCLPFEEAIKKTKEEGVKNLNGGDARFDYIYSSYSFIPPFGRWIAGQLQAHASGSNENTYTELWHEKFWAFGTVPETFKNSETPIRTLPMNLYYHIYCAEKEAALSALINNVKYAQNKECCPLFASEYADIVEGFYSTQFFSLGENKWKVANRGALQTIRFDQATLKSVDFSSSDGVIGQRHYQGSLYVYLDQTVETPIIALKEQEVTYKEPEEDRSYLIESRWKIWNVQMTDPSEITIEALGFGHGEMTWKVPFSGIYVIETIGEDEHLQQEVEAKNKILLVDIDLVERKLVTVKIKLKK